jgi:hypothetical protein
MATVGIIWLVFGLLYAFRPNYNKLLINDLKMLAKYINVCCVAPLSESELRRFAEGELVNIARDIVRADNAAKVFWSKGEIDKWDSHVAYSNEIKNKTFKPRHELFFSFGLVEKGWKIYFTKATETETSKQPV